MKASIAVIVLGLYILAMGVLSLSETGSLALFYIQGVISAVTIWLGWLLESGIKSVRNATKIWLLINVVLLGYMAFDRLTFSNDPRSGSGLIFGSIAGLALLAFFIVHWTESEYRGHSRPHRHHRVSRAHPST